MPPLDEVRHDMTTERVDEERTSGEYPIAASPEIVAVEAGRTLWNSKIDAALASLKKDEEYARQKIRERYHVAPVAPKPAAE